MIEDEEQKEQKATDQAAAKLFAAGRALGGGSGDGASSAAPGGASSSTGAAEGPAPPAGLKGLKLGWGRARGALAGAVAKAVAPLEGSEAPSKGGMLSLLPAAKSATPAEPLPGAATNAESQWLHGW